MKEWYAGLAPRERLIVQGGAIALALMLFYATIWDPLTGGARARADAVSEQQKLLAWMQQASEDVKRLRPASAQAVAQLPAGQSLLGVIDQTAKSSGLGAALKRVKPEGENKVSVWMEDAAFDDMVRWLETLRRTYGVEIDNIVVDRKNVVGKVDARIEFAGSHA
jgi:general secretion pathway protein M